VSVSYLHVSVLKKAKATATVKWRQMGVRSVHEALGIYATCTRTGASDVRAPPAAGVAFSGGRGRASSAAACPSLGGRTPTSFITARRPRTRTAERLLAGPRRSRTHAAVHPGVVRGARARGGRPVSGARRAGRYRLSRPCSG
jgi:hypothetical protein